jgi:uncharacterized repeat protein (TIGR04076 family)
MNNAERLQLNIHLDDIQSPADYKQVWARIPPVKITNTVENEKCPHRLGDTFIFKNHYDRPEGICAALHHVLQLYIWRASLGFPSWEPDNPNVFRIHCPAKKGTVWEVERCEEDPAARES